RAGLSVKVACDRTDPYLPFPASPAPPHALTPLQSLTPTTLSTLLSPPVQPLPPTYVPPCPLYPPHTYPHPYSNLSVYPSLVPPFLLHPIPLSPMPFVLFPDPSKSIPTAIHPHPHLNLSVYLLQSPVRPFPSPAIRNSPPCLPHTPRLHSPTDHPHSSPPYHLAPSHTPLHTPVHKCSPRFHSILQPASQPVPTTHLSLPSLNSQFPAPTSTYSTTLPSLTTKTYVSLHSSQSPPAISNPSPTLSPFSCLV
ncbi:hypothetical protein Pcinc_015620, partial [Petrolisthes cinctipes]